MFANGLLNCVSPLTLSPSFPPSLIPLSGLFPFVGQAGICTYSATKAAILALTRCTAIDVMLTLALSLPPTFPSAGCSIVNLGSISSFVGQAGMCTYSATKAAILALTRCTAIDCGAAGIRVNAICPGPILTEATIRHADSQVRGREGTRKGGRER